MWGMEIGGTFNAPLMVMTTLNRRSVIYKYTHFNMRSMCYGIISNKSN